jgi:hypothetical protein
METKGMKLFEVEIRDDDDNTREYLILGDEISNAPQEAMAIAKQEDEWTNAALYVANVRFAGTIDN